MFFAQFLRADGRFDALCTDAPLEYRSPNAPAVRDVVGTLLLGILAGHWRYAHLTALRFDAVAAAVFGLGRIVSEDSARRAVRRIDQVGGRTWLQRHLQSSYEELRTSLWVLDIDTTVKPLYGRQQGATLGYNPHKPGRPSHVYHTYRIASLRLCLRPPIKMKKWIILLLITAISYARSQTPGLAPQSLVPLERSFDAVLKEYAGADAIEEQSRAFETVIVAHGSDAIPVLIRLFHQNSDGLYRASVIEVLGQIDGGIADATQLIQSEVSKDRGEWGSETWVFKALVFLDAHDRPAAREVAYRILEHAPSQLLLGPAVGIFDRFGTLDDVPRLTDLALRWEADATSPRLWQIGVQRIRAAIGGIQRRSGLQAVERAPPVSKRADRELGKSATLQAKSRTAVLADKQYASDGLSSKKGWLLALGVLLVIVVIIIVRRT